jgi:hypothetical protein
VHPRLFAPYISAFVGLRSHALVVVVIIYDVSPLKTQSLFVLYLLNLPKSAAEQNCCAGEASRRSRWRSRASVPQTRVAPKAPAATRSGPDAPAANAAPSLRPRPTIMYRRKYVRERENSKRNSGG